MAMIYCAACSFWAEDDGEPTIIRDLTPSPVTIADRLPSSTRRNGTVRGFALVVVGLMILSGMGLYFLQRTPSRRGAVIAEGFGSAVEDPGVTNARGTIANRSRLSTIPSSLHASKVPAREVTVAVKQPIPVSPEPKRRSIAGRNEIMGQPMRTRVEIVDGIERCYALPGGRETGC